MKNLTSLTVLLLYVVSFYSFSSNDAWIFAHRTNSPNAIYNAINDNINAIEVDIMLSIDIPINKRCNNDLWCSFHHGDDKSYNLSEILDIASNDEILDNNISAVWFDVKSNNASNSDYEKLIQIVQQSLGVGDGTLRKFWGVWPADNLNNAYTQVIRNSFPLLGGNKENLFIIEVDNNNDSNIAANTCKEWNIQCGLSAGNPFIGDLGTSSGPSWDMQNINYLSGDIATKSNINSIFMWTFNWGGLYEDNMMRLLFGHRSYWEYLAGIEWQCGQEGNGVIIGAINSLYYETFCTENNDDDACSVAKSAILSGPNSLGDRYSNIGIPRNTYLSSNIYECNKYN
jgi:hypothetical protein